MTRRCDVIRNKVQNFSGFVCQSKIPPGLEGILGVVV